MAEPGNPRRSKLDWLKSLRGADLTTAEVYVLVLLASYSGASRENAHPGVTRVAEDSGLSKRQVQNILKSLTAKNAIAVTQEGGNQVFKGAATVYKILTPPQRPKGNTDDPLQGNNGEAQFTVKGETQFALQGGDSDPPGGDRSGTKGEISSTKGEISSTGRVKPSSAHQVIHQVNKHHSAPDVAGSPATQMSASNGGQDDTNANDQNDTYDIISALDELDEELGLDAVEATTAEAMLQRGSHFSAVRNKINKDRLQHFSGTFDAKQDQKRLEEEPRCKNCGVAMSRHAQWMAETGNAHIFATTVT